LGGVRLGRSGEISVAHPCRLDAALFERDPERFAAGSCLELGRDEGTADGEPRSQQLLDRPDPFGSKILRSLARLSTLEVAR
jgi:hypothetical protein